MARRMLTFVILLASSLAIALFTAPAVFAAEEVIPEAPVAEPGQAGCANLDLAALVDVGSPALQLLEVELEPKTAEPEWMIPLAGLKTCKCSCGFRCRTNADCGPGGICSAGITCC